MCGRALPLSCHRCFFFLWNKQACCLFLSFIISPSGWSFSTFTRCLYYCSLLLLLLSRQSVGQESKIVPCRCQKMTAFEPRAAGFRRFGETLWRGPDVVSKGINFPSRINVIVECMHAMSREAYEPLRINVRRAVQRKLSALHAFVTAKSRFRGRERPGGWRGERQSALWRGDRKQGGRSTWQQAGLCVE